MRKFFCLLTLFCCIFFVSINTYAQTINLHAPSLLPEVSLSLSPKAGSFVKGSTFDVPILIDTKGNSVNSVEVRVNFDQNKLSIVGPSGKTSIVGVWVEPPVYDNTLGTAKYIGVIPGGITTSSGLITSITFKAKSTGKAAVTLSANSKVLLNYGLGTAAKVNLGRANYNILPKATSGVNIFSKTHSFQSDWYNNNNPIISWEKEEGVSGFSYVLDNKPGTVPDNTSDTDSTTISFEDLKDGLWYFHIKSNKNNVWGQPSTFVVKIDISPPADFKPTTDYLLASLVLTERALVSFFTTDNLSGVDHYEVGVIDKSQPLTASPIFIESKSPFQVPLNEGANLRVIVRAFDRAGNIRESGIDVVTPFLVTNILKKYSLYIILVFLIVILCILILHYLFSHHILHHFKKAIRVFREEDDNDKSSAPPI